VPVVPWAPVPPVVPCAPVVPCKLKVVLYPRVLVDVLNTTILVSAAVPKLINLTEPLNCNGPPDPDTTIDSAPYLPILTKLS